MNLAQRVVLFIGGVLFTITSFVILLSNNLHKEDFILGGLMISLPAALFYYSFSNSRKPKEDGNEQSHIPVSQPLYTATNENAKKLDNLLTMTENRLFKLSSVFPFELFPDKIIIEQKQIILIRNQFFSSSQDYQILIKDILMPIVESSVFFATLKIKVIIGDTHQNPPSISFLKKNEALKAKRIIMGLIICDREKIDLSAENPSEIVKKVEEIGRIKIN